MNSSPPPKKVIVSGDGSECAVLQALFDAHHQNYVVEPLSKSESESTIRALTKENDRLHELVEMLPGIIVEADHRCRPVFVNRNALETTGYDSDEFCRYFAKFMIFEKAHRSQVASSVDNTLANQKVGAQEFQLLSKTGETIPVAARFSAIVKGGQVVGFWAIMFEITELKLAQAELARKEEQLRFAQKMEAIGALAGGVAHDFNNIITAISSFGELGLFELDETEPLHEYIQGILDAAKRASGLTKQLLAFSRKQESRPEVLDLNMVVQNLEKMLSRLIREDIHLSFILMPELNYVYADQGQIEQIILNLIINARDALPQGGYIVIETENRSEPPGLEVNDSSSDAPGSVVLSVSDNGFGMDRATTARIFEPFFTTKQEGKGTGLGLSTVYGIVKQSGGTIVVESELGEGSRFEISLPVAPAKKGIKPSAVPDAGTFGGSEWIMVVEDDDILRDVMGNMLRVYGYRVLEASNANQALELCGQTEQEIDLLISDIVMPGISGPQLVRKLEKIRPGIPVLYMSGYSDEPIVRQVRSLSAGCFIRKPFASQELAVKVREVLSTYANEGSPSTV